MAKTLVNKSDFFILKSKFFLYRIVIYFTFLLVPVLLTQTVNLDIAVQAIILIFYMLFMGSQWYLLGKEIDYRLKIYYRANSSMDRILYRFLTGSIVMTILFNLVSFLPSFIINYFFWAFFMALGLFYSWPTRGKIIQESVTDQFSEFKFLDSFEKTVFFLSFFMFIFSLPEIPLFQNIEALKLYFDPREVIHPQVWSFLSVNYLPFLSYPKTYALAWSLHFYIFGMGFCLLALYGLLRYFVSRRLSVLGVFALISSWSIPKILEQDYLAAYTSSFVILWVWSLLWSSKSSTYRSGLFIGLIHYYGACINTNYLILLPIHLIISYRLSFSDKTIWFKKQWCKYTIFGSALALLAFITHADFSKMINGASFSFYFEELLLLIQRKAFYVLSYLGVILFLFYQKGVFKKYFKEITFEKKSLLELNLLLLSIFVLGFTLERNLIVNFGSLWLLVLFSLIPLEWIFQSISRLRSKRNLIYALYILVCLLDSHFEGRVRIVGKMFLNEDLLKYIQQM